VEPPLARHLDPEKGSYSGTYGNRSYRYNNAMYWYRQPLRWPAPGRRSFSLS
jgi:hypothetical protein